ncbi:hypothetical protein AOLI_G00125170 [Acnodon oligacanthus]
MTATTGPVLGQLPASPTDLRLPFTSLHEEGGGEEHFSLISECRSLSIWWLLSGTTEEEKGRFIPLLINEAQPVFPSILSLLPLVWKAQKPKRERGAVGE